MPAIQPARPLQYFGGPDAARAPPLFPDFSPRSMSGYAFRDSEVRGKIEMTRRVGLSILVVSLAAFTLTAPSAAQQRQALGLNVRFDLVQILQGTALAGGSDFGLDASGDRVELTGSGEFKPGAKDAAGGGTFVHRHADGTEFAHGIWVVTGFASWAPGGGNFSLTGLADGIGEVSEASAGIVTLHVRLSPAGGSPVNAMFEVHCHFPGASIDTEEGIRLFVGPFAFQQDGGVTLFHILQ